MGGIRKDYLGEHFTIITRKANGDDDGSLRLSDNAGIAEPAVLSLVAQDGILKRFHDVAHGHIKEWAVRVFENNYPIVSTGAENAYGEKPHYSEPAYGYHYIIVTSSGSTENLSSVNKEAWLSMLMVIQDRMQWLYAQRKVSYVAVHSSYSGAAVDGAQTPHMHVVALPTIPPVIGEEIRTATRMYDERGVCPVCQIVKAEAGGPRMILKMGGFVAFCPWSPRYPYEFWIVPENHLTSFAKVTQKRLDGLATMIRATLGGLSNLIGDVPYSIVFHLSPETKNTKQIHWHVEVYPITEEWSGLERGYGIYVNSKSPEDAASELGGLCRREVAVMVDVD